eukprot:388816_1
MSSPACLLSLFAVHFWSVFGQSNVCIWNVVYDGQGNPYTKVNGLYELQEEKFLNGNFYINTANGCEAGGIYLYWKLYNWVIGTDPSNHSSSTVTGAYGKCMEREITVDNPSGACTAWQIPALVDDNSTDAKITATLGNCPAWNAACTELSVVIAPASSDGCDGTFAYDSSSGYDNVYSKVVDDTTTIYWYFNYHSFQWVCDDTVEMDTCTVGGVFQKSFSAHYWQDIDTSGVTTVNLDSSKASQFTCTETVAP